jgi:hypothetical protein
VAFIINKKKADYSKEILSGHILLSKMVDQNFELSLPAGIEALMNFKSKDGDHHPNLPDNNVLFISNHQTYFADVVAMFHVFNASLSGREDTIKNVTYLGNRKNE